MLTFLINHANIIMLMVWEVITVIALLRYFEISFFKKISWKLLFIFVIALRVVYGVLLTWGQHILWSNPQLQFFLIAPLSAKVPLLGYLEIFRPYLEKPGGYFIFYSFNLFFLSTLVLFFMTALISSLLLLWSKYSPSNFKKGDILIVALTMLIAGWLGIIVLIPAVFLILIASSFVNGKSFKEKYFSLPSVFLISLPFIILLAVPLLKVLDLYILFKI